MAAKETRTFYLQPLSRDREPDSFTNNKIQTHLTHSNLYSCKLEILALTNYREKEALKPFLKTTPIDFLDKRFTQKPRKILLMQYAGLPIINNEASMKKKFTKCQ